MIGLEIRKNGRRLATAAWKEASVLTAIVTWVSGNAAARRPQQGFPKDCKPGHADLHLGALRVTNEVHEHGSWLEALPLRVGDRVEVTLVDSARETRAKQVTRRTCADIEAAQDRYVTSYLKRKKATRRARKPENHPS
jgi:hypothetical protein